MSKLSMVIMFFVVLATAQVKVLSSGNSDSPQKAPETVIEITVDSVSEDSQIPIELRQYLIHGSAVTSNAHITYYSNNKVADLPATLSIPNGKYNFNTNNNTRYGKTAFNVEAEGGYQKWEIIPGNSKKARKWQKKSNISFYTGLSIGGTLATIGHIMKATSKSDIESANYSYESAMKSITSATDRIEGYREDIEDEYNSSYVSHSMIQTYYDWIADAEADINEAEAKVTQSQQDIKNAENKQSTANALLVAGYSTLTVGITIAIPTNVKSRKHRMKARKVESKASAPVESLESEGLSQ